MKKSYNSSTPKIVGGLTIGFIAVLALYLFVAQPLINDSQEESGNTQNTASIDQESTIDTPTTIPSTSQPSSENSQTETNANTTYSDGNYQSDASYRAPHGSNSINIDITIKNDQIVALQTDNNYTDHESEHYIERFEAAIEDEVLNIDIEDISLSRVGGASLTTSAFKQALSTALDEAI